MRFRPVFFLALLFVGSGLGLWAHPLHLSVTEAIYDREAERLSLAVRVFPDDLEAVLSEQTKTTISVDKPDELAPAALDYVRKTLLVKDASGAPAKLEWAGLDVTKTHVWLFLETDLHGGTLGARFNVTLMQEKFPDQLNSVQLRDGAVKVTLVFDRDSGEKTVTLPRLPAK